MKVRVFLLAALLGLAFVPRSLSQETAQPCDEALCQPPNCRCSGVEIPGNLTRAETPQLVFLSFDEALNIDNFPLYQDVLFTRTNPNGELITATFYVSHDYSNYSQIHELWRRGHEIGLHSISVNPSEAYWRGLNATGWNQEILDQRTQMSTFARIPVAEIKGVRAPQLILGGDTMYDVIEKARMTYDCSRPTQNFMESGIWPYTNDYASIQDCTILPCPENVHKGLWSVPMINLIGDEDTKVPCAMVDHCQPEPRTEQATFDLLNNNFKRHHEGHRAPFGIFLRHGWINGTAGEGDDSIQERRKGFDKFLDHLATLNDTYIVSISRGLEWVKTPVALKDVANFSAFKTTVRDSQCTSTQNCRYREGQTPFKPPQATDREFRSCSTCPPYYPWVGNHLGQRPYQ